MFGNSDALVRDYEFLQQLLAFNEWRTPHVVAVTIQYVEKIIGDGNLHLQLFGRILYAEARLQPLKIATPLLIQDDNLSVEDRCLRANDFRQIAKFWIFGRNRPRRTSHQLGRIILDHGKRANSVPFNFKEPIVARKWFLA